MKGKITFLLLLLPGFLLGCQTERESITQGRSWGEPSNGLRCSIDVEKTRWSKGDPALVSVIIENVSGSKVNLKTISTFTLNEMQFVCPVDIERGGQALPPNARSTISLEKDALMNLRIDISKLKWGMGVSSIWPDHSFYSLVPPGRYKLRMDIEVVDGGLLPRIIPSALINLSRIQGASSSCLQAENEAQSSWPRHGFTRCRVNIMFSVSKPWAAAS